MATDHNWLEEMLGGPEFPTRTAALAKVAPPGAAVMAADPAADMMFRLLADSFRSLEPTLPEDSPLRAAELQALQRCADALVLLAKETLR